MTRCVECPVCGVLSECVWRCVSCGKDLVDESSTAAQMEGENDL